MIIYLRCLRASLRAFTRTAKLHNLQKTYIYSLASQDISHVCCSNLSGALPRCFATRDAGHLKEVSFEEFQKLKKNTDTVVIDVRTPKELSDHGMIPGSTNIPLDEIKTAFKDMSDDTFLKKYGRKKPDKDALIIFFCRSQNRSRKAQALAIQLGYQNALIYLGGWTDWDKKTKSK